jgi:hypothetical protein
LNGKQSAPPVRARNYSPSEFSQALAEFGISLCVAEIRRRCGRPKADELHIATLHHFPGRWYIPESELFRIVGVKESAT